MNFPLPSQESIFDLIVTHCGKFQVDSKVEAENSNITISTTPNDPQVIEIHWSHKNHPLQQLHSNISENGDGNDDVDDDEDRRVLICDGCIQPITVLHWSYYACIQCNFFLHSFCATKLPQELPVGASTSHPNHSLVLRKTDRFYSLVICGVCWLPTNGFYYHCQTCDIKIDIRCAFLPTRIKHKSHKNHSLVQRPSSNSICSLTSFRNDFGVEYACETCNNFQIHIYCAIFPSRVEHMYDIHHITLRYPPFFYEGVFYCEICEEQVDNQELLYHCSESEHSFHYYCFSFHRTIKLGGIIDVTIMDKPHTLTLVVKLPTRKNSTYTCNNCTNSYYSLCYLFECDGCGYLACCQCALNLFDE